MQKTAKKVISLLATATLLAALLCACVSTGSGGGEAMTPETRTTLYQSAIEDARDTETNAAYGLVTTADDPSADLIFELLGLETDDVSSFALSVSAMNVQAYGVAAVYPATGKEEDVLEGMGNFIDRQKESFYQYLMEEYDVASSTRLETLEDGTILMVMAPDQDALFDKIRDAIEGGKAA